MSGVRASLPAPTIYNMYRVYYSKPTSITAYAFDTDYLSTALKEAEKLRQMGMIFVSVVSDYADMVGKPGAQGAGSEYVPQLKN
jgi:hypothetical protein